MPTDVGSSSVGSATELRGESSASQRSYFLAIFFNFEFFLPNSVPEKKRKKRFDAQNVKITMKVKKSHHYGNKA
jgi:hypothetical protein